MPGFVLSDIVLIKRMIYFLNYFMLLHFDTLLLFHFLPGSICSVEIYVVQQRLASKIEMLRNDSAAARRDAPGTLLRRSAAAPGGNGLID